MSELIYLAYGSNLHPARLQARVPSATAVEVIALSGWRLCFHKRGQDGSAKCNIRPGARPADRVHAVLYRIAAGHKSRLDEAEGLGNGYELAHLDVGKLGQAFFYLASAAHIDDTLRPYHWYKHYVLAGAQHHALPAEYCAQISAVGSMADPDVQRDARHRQVLEEHDGLLAGTDFTKS